MIRGIFEKRFLNKKVEVYSVFYLKKPFHYKGVLRQNIISFDNGEEYFDKTYMVEQNPKSSFKISHIGKIVYKNKSYFPNGKIAFDEAYWKKRL